MTDKHTKGPWKRDIAHIGKNTFEGKLCEAAFRYDQSERDGAKLVALIPHDEDINIIVSAPEMLEALKGINDFCKKIPYDVLEGMDITAISDVIDAIDKAEGNNA